jgi:hypothetical protein
MRSADQMQADSFINERPSRKVVDKVISSICDRGGSAVDFAPLLVIMLILWDLNAETASLRERTSRSSIM